MEGHADVSVPIAGVWVNAFLTAAGGATLYYIW